MKLKILFLSVIAGNILSAQNVTFGNANFKTKIVNSSASNTTAKNLGGSYFAVDANADGEIQETEAQQVSELNISSSGIASLVGINSFTNLTKLVCTGNPLSGVADLTGLNLINYIDIAIGSLNLGTKANLETLLLSTGTSTLTYDSPTATLKTFRGMTPVFLSINYLKRLALQDITINKFGINFPYSALKYHMQVNRLYLGTNFTSNGDAAVMTFTDYNPLDAPVYPQNIKTLVIGQFFGGLPIGNFHNLESLTFASTDPANPSTGCPTCQIFNPTDFPNLKELNFLRNYNPILNLDLSPLTHLEKFTTHDISFDGDDNPGMQFTINFGNNPNLSEVSFQELPTGNLDFSQNVNLKKIGILSQLPQFINFLNININLAPANNLEEIDFNGYIFNSSDSEWSNQGITLNNIDQSSKLKKVKLQYCRIVNPFPITSQFFTNFIAYDSFFNTLDFGHLPNFNHFELTNFTTITQPTFPVNDLSIDLSGCTALPQIDITYPKLRYLSIKNGVEDNDGDIYNDGNGLTLCIDNTDYDNAIFPNGMSNWDLPANTVVTNYCETLAPEGSFNSLIGKVRFDGDANGCDNNDVIVPNMNIKSTAGLVNSYTASNATGDYLQYLGLGNYTSVPVFENPGYFVVPTPFASSFTTYDNIQTQDICIVPNGTHNDLDVTIIPINVARPGLNAKYKIIYKNKGTTVLSGNLAFQYDDAVMDLVASSVAPTSQSTGMLNWDFNLNRFETKQIVVEMNLNTPTETPPLDDGSPLHYAATINPVLADETPNDNVFNLNQVVRNSHDPNDKTCLEGSSVGTIKIGDYVNYMIRFENTGSAEAINVVVKDVINTAKFDVNSIQAIDASHPFRMTVTENNKVEFFFENIMLPGTPSELRYGYIVFKIKLKSTLTNGTTFSNSANIYFDYNAPVVTNTFVTTIQNLGMDDSAIHPKLVAYPNPVKDNLHFETTIEITKAEIYDVSGRVIITSGVSNNTINLSALKTGNYIVKIFTGNEVMYAKVIKE
ncbi:T9SS type A sorting domain-containing protein [Flavobacterium wongokense]|uniref:T9SS type A sorting domain-containing protein n=1 Tax=Flavobacterium wongokense TaxID=2910674 RepID=UPI001F25F941|nr:T9SS type A sorting domain-containing protein [Flavobacterium sp. WG47]MCF6131854.1 T9SS type A sorting domain-containing protein [Flavobacterium sp. WG47]